MDIWAQIKRNLKLGRELKAGAYVVHEHKATAIILRRVATGSLVRVTRSKCIATVDRLASGEAIAKRSISYTVAEEFGVVVALGRLIKATETGYEAGKSLEV